MKPELLAPAGSLEKAKIALLYGADAVYVGGQKFSLRARASNFTIEEIEKLCDFAHQLNKKVYVTMNIILRNEDVHGLDEYLKALEQAKVDAIIVSSPYIIKRAKMLTNLACHLSTQKSVTNHQTLAYYENQGLERVVLAREVTLNEMGQIVDALTKRQSKLELEVFIHGGMCSSISGRCVLSNYMTDRDANRGGCAHSCRWNYTLFQNNEKVEQDDKFCHIASKDLMALKHIETLIKYGIASLKIEGRMKSAYYLATVVSTYRQKIDQILGLKPAVSDEYLVEQIKKAENRQTSDGFYRGLPGVDGHLYDNRCEEVTKEYIGQVIEYNPLTKMAIIEQRNYFECGQVVEFFGPSYKLSTMVVKKMWDAKTGEELTVARHPLQLIRMEVAFSLETYDMMRLALSHRKK